MLNLFCNWTFRRRLISNIFFCMLLKLNLFNRLVMIFSWMNTLFDWFLSLGMFFSFFVFLHYSNLLLSTWTISRQDGWTESFHFLLPFFNLFQLFVKNSNMFPQLIQFHLIYWVGPIRLTFHRVLSTLFLWKLTTVHWLIPFCSIFNRSVPRVNHKRSWFFLTLMILYWCIFFLFKRWFRRSFFNLLNIFLF